MTVELWMLTGVAILQFILLHLHGQYTAFTAGILWGTGSRNKPRPVPVGPFGYRIERCIINNIESLAVFVPLVCIISLIEKTSDLTALGTQIFFGARVVYTILYLANIPYVRTFAWLMSQFSLIMICFVIIVQ